MPATAPEPVLGLAPGEPLHVLVPTVELAEAAQGVSARVRAHVADPREGAVTGEAARARVWVPPAGPGAGVPDNGFLAGLPELRLVQLQSAGAEAYIGRLPEGVVLCNARGAHTPATAEWVMAAVLAAQRGLPTFVREQDAGRWSTAVHRSLVGARVLVVGAGDIGAAIGRMMAGFDVQLSYVARTARDGVHGVGELPELLPHADVVVLVVPVTPQTTGLVDADFLGAMPDGALLVNAARGVIVDTDALLAELIAGRLRAALDVTDPEPLPAGHPLWSAPGLLLTPHVGGAVPQSGERAARAVTAQLARLLAGEPPADVVGDY